MPKKNMVKGIEVPLGGRITIEGRVYECVEELKERYCYGCDLFYRICFGKVVCTKENRKDGKGVIFKKIMK